MSVDWGVVPALPEESGFREWITSAGLEIPQSPGRFPTLEGLMSVLQSFEGLPIQKETYGESSYGIFLGEQDADRRAYILGNITNDHFQFHFFGSSNQEIMMMDILKRLAGICGPLILYESIAATPVIVDSSTNLEQALEDWRRRSQQRYSKDMVE